MRIIFKGVVMVTMALMFAQNCGAVTTDEYCAEVYEVARVTMEARQYGV